MSGHLDVTRDDGDITTTSRVTNGRFMAFVKLDCGLLRSSLWVERDHRSLFLTALLMAEPYELATPTPQLYTRTLDETGWIVPAGWYGFIRAAGVGIIRQDGMEREAGLAALEALASPDPESRSQDFEGRRLVRIDGGYLALNYFKYRDYDHTGAERQQRMRDRKKAKAEAEAQSNALRNAVTRDSNVTSHIAECRLQITEADAEKRVLPARLFDSMTLTPAERRFFDTFYATAHQARALDIRTQLSQALTVGTKYNGSLVRAFDAAHLDDVLGQVCDGRAMRDPNLAIIVVLKKLAETYLEVKSAAEKSTEIQRSTP